MIMVVQQFVVTPMMVVHETQEGDSNADHSPDYQDNKDQFHGIIQVSEEDLRIREIYPAFHSAVVGCVATTNPYGG
jgi:hypothetical protein